MTITLRARGVPCGMCRSLTCGLRSDLTMEFGLATGGGDAMLALAATAWCVGAGGDSAAATLKVTVRFALSPPAPPPCADEGGALLRVCGASVQRRAESTSRIAVSHPLALLRT